MKNYKNIILMALLLSSIFNVINLSLDDNLVLAEETFGEYYETYDTDGMLCQVTGTTVTTKYVDVAKLAERNDGLIVSAVPSGYAYGQNWNTINVFIPVSGNYQPSKIQLDIQLTISTTWYDNWKGGYYTGWDNKWLYVGTGSNKYDILRICGIPTPSNYLSFDGLTSIVPLPSGRDYTTTIDGKKYLVLTMTGMSFNNYGGCSSDYINAYIEWVSPSGLDGDYVPKFLTHFVTPETVAINDEVTGLVQLEFTDYPGVYIEPETLSLTFDGVNLIHDRELQDDNSTVYTFTPHMNNMSVGLHTITATVESLGVTFSDDVTIEVTAVNDMYNLIPSKIQSNINEEITFKLSHETDSLDYLDTKEEPVIEMYIDDAHISTVPNISHNGKYYEFSTTPAVKGKFTFDGASLISPVDIYVGGEVPSGELCNDVIIHLNFIGDNTDYGVGRRTIYLDITDSSGNKISTVETQSMWAFWGVSAYNDHAIAYPSVQNLNAKLASGEATWSGRVVLTDRATRTLFGKKIAGDLTFANHGTININCGGNTLTWDLDPSVAPVEPIVPTGCNPECTDGKTCVDGKCVMTCYTCREKYNAQNPPTFTIQPYSGIEYKVKIIYVPDLSEVKTDWDIGLDSDTAQTERINYVYKSPSGITSVYPECKSCFGEEPVTPNTPPSQVPSYKRASAWDKLMGRDKNNDGILDKYQDLSSEVPFKITFVNSKCSSVFEGSNIDVYYEYPLLSGGKQTYTTTLEGGHQVTIPNVGMFSGKSMVGFTRKDVNTTFKIDAHQTACGGQVFEKVINFTGTTEAENTMIIDLGDEGFEEGSVPFKLIILNSECNYWDETQSIIGEYVYPINDTQNYSKEFTVTHVKSGSSSWEFSGLALPNVKVDFDLVYNNFKCGGTKTHSFSKTLTNSQNVEDNTFIVDVGQKEGHGILDVYATDSSVYNFALKRKALAIDIVGSGIDIINITPPAAPIIHYEVPNVPEGTYEVIVYLHYAEGSSEQDDIIKRIVTQNVNIQSSEVKKLELDFANGEIIDDRRPINLHLVNSDDTFFFAKSHTVTVKGEQKLTTPTSDTIGYLTEETYTESGISGVWWRNVTIEKGNWLFTITLDGEKKVFAKVVDETTFTDGKLVFDWANCVKGVKFHVYDSGLPSQYKDDKFEYIFYLGDPVSGKEYSEGVASSLFGKVGADYTWTVDKSKFCIQNGVLKYKIQRFQPSTNQMRTYPTSTGVGYALKEIYGATTIEIDLKGKTYEETKYYATCIVLKTPEKECAIGHIDLHDSALHLTNGEFKINFDNGVFTTGSGSVIGGNAQPIGGWVELNIAVPGLLEGTHSYEALWGKTKKVGTFVVSQDTTSNNPIEIVFPCSAAGGCDGLAGRMLCYGLLLYFMSIIGILVIAIGCALWWFLGFVKSIGSAGIKIVSLGLIILLLGVVITFVAPHEVAKPLTDILINSPGVQTFLKLLSPIVSI